MAQPYLRDLQTLVAAHGASVDIECRHFFSGAAAYTGGQIFMSLSPAGLALKLPEEDRKVLLEAGGKALRYFAKAPIKKDYVVLDEGLASSPDQLAAWISKSIEFSRS